MTGGMIIKFVWIFLVPFDREQLILKLILKKIEEMRMQSAKSHASQNKNRNNPNKTVVSYSFRDLCDSREKQKDGKTKDQLQWLESIVNGFGHYAFNKNQLFTNQQQDSLENTNKGQVKYLKNFQIIKVSPKNKKNTDIDTVRSKSTNKTVIKEQKISKNLNPQSQQKNKLNMTMTNIKEKTVAYKKSKVEVSKINKNLSKQNKENKKIVQSKDRGQNEVEKKLEMYNKASLNRKATNIKAARKNLLIDQSATGNMKRVGKIVRNLSIQNSTVPTKQTENQFDNFINIHEVVTEQYEPKNSEMDMTVTKFSSKNEVKNERETTRKEIDPREVLKKQLAFNKYEYYIESSKNTEEKKRQRKFNSSVGSRQKNRKQEQSFSTSRVPNNYTSQRNQRINTLEEVKYPSKNHKKLEDTDQNEGKDKLCVSHLCQEEQMKVSSQYSNKRKEFLNPSSSEIKVAISMKNSQMPSNQSFVIDSHKLYQGQHKQVNDWNILGIFSKLDSRKTGILDSKNCSIESLSRQIRYIMGPILEQILYRNATYTIGEFIEKSDQILDKIKESNLEKEIQNFMEIKQFAPMTKRSPKYEQPELLHERYEKDFYKNAVSNGNTEENSQISVISQKYQFHHEKQEKGDQEQYNCYELKAKKDICQQYKNFSIKSKQLKGNVRFATFQNQTSEDEQERQKQSKLMQKRNKNDLQAKLQKQLQNLNSFRASNDVIAKIRLKSQSSNAQILRNDEEQMAKLELLNLKLEKYLIDQSIKEISSSNNFQSESFSSVK